MSLIDKKCVPCEGGVAPFDKEKVAFYMEMLGGSWTNVDDKLIQKSFSFKDFKEALAFVNKVGELAESEGHHPDIHIHYNKVVIELFTHAIDGLSENDFIVAAKIDRVK